jgi:hypothetical protein
MVFIPFKILKEKSLLYLRANILFMKRKAISGALFLFLAWAATSCSDLGDCQFCKIVESTSSGTEVNSGSETEYCGTDLEAFKAANPTITNPVTGNVTKVECN